MTLTPMKTVGRYVIFSRPRVRPKGVPRYVVYREDVALEEFVRYSRAHAWAVKQKKIDERLS